MSFVQLPPAWPGLCNLPACHLPVLPTPLWPSTAIRASRSLPLGRACCTASPYNMRGRERVFRAGTCTGGDSSPPPAEHIVPADIFRGPGRVPAAHVHTTHRSKLPNLSCCRESWNPLRASPGRAKRLE